MSRWLARLIAGLALVACNQTGGGDQACLCATGEVITATPYPTPTDSNTPVPSPTPSSTPRPSPTMLPPMATWTAAPDECPGYRAAPRKNEDYIYRDFRGTGLRQNLRRGPGLGYAVVGTIAANIRYPVYFTKDGWEALDPGCRVWILNSLGDLLPHSTN